ncbi:MAG: AtpZ/AtpI family protein [Planctomycetaceae bacterium]|nr:AtpZ/AtpI family protein [Planctomycetaceae bacterium]
MGDLDKPDDKKPLGGFSRSRITNDDGRSPVVLGYVWATIVMTMAIELIVPILLGVYADYKLGTKCVFLFFGIFIGFFIMVVNFVKLMKSKGFGFQQTGNTRKHEKGNHSEK